MWTCCLCGSIYKDDVKICTICVLPYEQNVRISRIKKPPNRPELEKRFQYWI